MFGSCSDCGGRGDWFDGADVSEVAGPYKLGDIIDCCPDCFPGLISVELGVAPVSVWPVRS